MFFKWSSLKNGKACKSNNLLLLKICVIAVWSALADILGFRGKGGHRDHHWCHVVLGALGQIWFGASPLPFFLLFSLCSLPYLFVKIRSQTATWVLAYIFFLSEILTIVCWRCCTYEKHTVISTCNFSSKLRYLGDPWTLSILAVWL